MKDMDHDKEKQVTAEDLFKARTNAAARMMLSYVHKGCPGGHEAELYALNLCRDLGEFERGALAALMLSTFPADMAERLCQAWFEGAGYPSAKLMDDPRADARFWASDANSKEIGAYAMACFERMSPKRKAEFSKWVHSQIEKQETKQEA